MIALVVPAAPGLLPARGLADPFAEVRAQTVDLIRHHLADAAGVAALVPPLSALDRRRGLRVPPRLRVAEHLLAAAGGGGPLLADPAGAELLLVLADGSARRTTSSPGPFDERAVAFDDALAEALRTGDAAALAALDEDLATELWCQGAAPLRALAALLPRPASAELLDHSAPFGVGYLRARWRS